MSNSEMALQVDRLSVRFGATEVLHDLSFAVPKGSCLAVIGPNAAGKTVLLKALIGALRYKGDVVGREYDRWLCATKA